MLAWCPPTASPQVELQVQCHLIVPAATGVDLAAHRPHQLGEPPLDGHVDVLVLRVSS